MKKIVSISFFLAIVLLFSGCSRYTATYEQLSQTEQKNIQNIIKKELLDPYIQKTIEMTSVTGVDTRAIIDTNAKELHNNLKKFLAKEYPTIDFTTLLEKSQQNK